MATNLNLAVTLQANNQVLASRSGIIPFPHSNLDDLSLAPLVANVPIPLVGVGGNPPSNLLVILSDAPVNVAITQQGDPQPQVLFIGSILVVDLTNVLAIGLTNPSNTVTANVKAFLAGD